MDSTSQEEAPEMSNTNQDQTDNERDQALKYLAARRNLARQAGTYLMVVAFMTTIWALGDRNNFWPVWIIIGGAFGLGTQALSVFTSTRPIAESTVQHTIDGRR
jgi:hypothetical protein